MRDFLLSILISRHQVPSNDHDLLLLPNDQEPIFCGQRVELPNDQEPVRIFHHGKRIHQQPTYDLDLV